MKKIVLILLVICLLFVGCSKDKEQEVTNTPQEEDTAAQAEEIPTTQVVKFIDVEFIVGVEVEPYREQTKNADFIIMADDGYTYSVLSPHGWDESTKYLGAVNDKYAFEPLLEVFGFKDVTEIEEDILVKYPYPYSLTKKYEIDFKEKKVYAQCIIFRHNENMYFVAIMHPNKSKIEQELDLFKTINLL